MIVSALPLSWTLITNAFCMSYHLTGVFCPSSTATLTFRRNPGRCASESSIQLLTAKLRKSPRSKVSELPAMSA
ncbi:hypothetical protein [Kitasatospora sp. LaBMicrA B282]|uniref:hypothetical protein n=1 Tax=Kitasatospora sp. LaBMicrA B282 TaxID=3420949 RepID=UPI003D0EA322